MSTNIPRPGQSTRAQKQKAPKDKKEPRIAAASIGGPSVLSQEQWDQVIKDADVLRAWRVGSAWDDEAEEPVFAINPGSYSELHVKKEGIFDKTYDYANAVEQSLLRKGFSDVGVTAALSGGFAGVSGNAAFNLGVQKSEQHRSGQSQTTNGNYRFTYYPRVQLNLIERHLNLSPYCLRWFEKLDKEEWPIEVIVAGFQKIFGVVFSERVLLGGKIVETGGERRNTDLRSTETKRQRDLSGEVGASAFGVGGNVKAHDKTGTEASEKGRSTAREGGTTRTVVGGDALVFRRDNRENLDWEKSLRPYHNWAVIERTNVVPLLPLLHEIAHTRNSQVANWTTRMTQYLREQSSLVPEEVHFVDIEVYSETDPPFPSSKLQRLFAFRSHKWNYLVHLQGSVEQAINRVDLNLDQDAQHAQPSSSTSASRSRKPRSQPMEYMIQPPFKGYIEGTIKSQEPPTVSTTVVLNPRWGFVVSKDKALKDVQFVNYRNKDEDHPQTYLSALELSTLMTKASETRRVTLGLVQH